MMHRVPALFFVVPFEHWKVQHPQRAPPAFSKAALVPDFATQRTQRLVDDFRAVGTKENEIARLRTAALKYGSYHGFREELEYRRLQTRDTSRKIVHLDV